METRPFDPAVYLDSKASLAAYLADAFASGDAAEIADALGVVARAKGMTQIAAETGLSRQSLYKALSTAGRPELPTLVKVLDALGLKLAVAPAA